MVLVVISVMGGGIALPVELEDRTHPHATEIGSSVNLTTRKVSTTQHEPSSTDSDTSSTKRSDSTDSSDGGVLLSVDDFDELSQSAWFSFCSPRHSRLEDTSVPSKVDGTEAVGIAVSTRGENGVQPQISKHERDQIPPQAGVLEANLKSAAESDPVSASPPTTSNTTPFEQPREVAEVPRSQQLTVPTASTAGEGVKDTKQKTSRQRRRYRRGRKLKSGRGE